VGGLPPPLFPLPGPHPPPKTAISHDKAKKDEKNSKGGKKEEHKKGR